MTTGPAAGFATTSTRNRTYKRDSDGQFSSGGGGGATGQDALDAAPLGLTDVKVNEFTGRVTSKPGPGMSAEEGRAFSSYRHAGFVKVNGGLRKNGGEVDPDSPAGKTVAHMDAALSRSRLTDDISVERGLRNGETAFGDRWQSDLTGARFVDHGYVSTTTDSRISSDFSHVTPSDTGGGTVRMHVPAGTPAVRLSGREHESELILGRGLTYEITSDTGPGPGRVLEISVVEQGND